LCLLNFSDQPQTLSLPGDGDWKKLLDSADEAWQKPDSTTRSTAPVVAPSDSTIQLQPESIVIYGLGNENMHLMPPTPFSERHFQE
jgi:maltooligosyltrehalose trehalohydrolase